MMYRKLFAIVFSVLSISATLSSCSGNYTANPESSFSADISSSDNEYRMEQKVTYLSCASVHNEYVQSPEILPLGNGKLLLLYSEFKEANDCFISTLQIVDITSDRVTAEKNIDAPLTIASTCDDGFIIEDHSEMSYHFFDCNLQELFQYYPPENYGTFSPDGKTYYFISAGKLWSTDIVTNEMTCIESEYGIRYSFINSISGDGSYLFINGDSSTANIDHIMLAGVDLRSHKTELLAYDMSEPAVCDNFFFFHKLYENDEDMKSVFYTSSFTDKNAVGFEEDEYIFSAIKNSEYFICSEISDDINIYIGQAGDHICNMSFIAGGEIVYGDSSFQYMAEEKLIAFSITDHEDAKIGLIDTRFLETDKTLRTSVSESPAFLDVSISDEYIAALAIPEVPEYLSKLRQRADVLEEKYGIKIYLSSQCRGMVTSDKEYSCTDELSRDGDTSIEISLLETALDELETFLLKYPNGFFKQFKTVTGDGGLRFCLIAGISDGFSTAFAIHFNEWYNMLFDVTCNIAPNLPHELWHSTESFICDHDYDLLSDELWSTLNPDGFAYTEDYANYMDIDDEYCFPYEEWYFFDAYSKVNIREDKARIMEIVMSPEIYDADSFLASEHIAKKLETMCSAMRKVFDTDGWNDIYWERYRQ